MPDNIEEDGGRAYWRGRTDTRMDNIELRLCALDDQTQKIYDKLEHVHTCLEQRFRPLYVISGGIAILYILLQIGVPLFLRFIVKP